MVDNSLSLNFEKTVAKMEMQLQVFAQESCQVIHTYLTIFGKMTPNALMEKLDYSRGTIFKSLLHLQEAGYAKKEVDEKIADKRKNIYYVAMKESIDLKGSADFIEYLIAQDKLDVFTEWLKRSQTLVATMIKTVHQISIKEMIDKLEKRDTNFKESEVKKFSIQFAEVTSIKDQEKLVKMMNECITEFENQMVKREDYEKPLSNPVAFSLFFTHL